MNWFQVIGYIATVLSIGMYLPQTISVIKQKKTGTLSKSTFLIILFGCLMWTLYSNMPTVATGTSYGKELADALPGFITNGTIVFLMFPIVWYLFANSKYRITIFVSIVAASLTLLTIASIIMFDRELLLGSITSSTSDILSYFFVSVAGASTGLPFFPQMVKIVKENRIGDISILSSLLIFLGNVIWVAYWTGRMIDSAEGSMYISIAMSAAGALMQIPIVYVYVKNSKKTKA